MAFEEVRHALNLDKNTVLFGVPVDSEDAGLSAQTDELSENNTTYETLETFEQEMPQTEIINTENTEPEIIPEPISESSENESIVAEKPTKKRNRHHKEEIVEVNMNKDENKFCTASMDLTSKIFDIEEGKCILTLLGHNDVVSKCSFNTEGNKVLTGSYDKTCKIFDVNNGNLLFDFTEHSKEISNCFFYPLDNNIIISTSLDGLCKIYDIRNNSQSLNTFDNHNKNEILCSTISSSGKYLATGGGDNIVNVYDLTQMEKIFSLEGHNKEIYSLDFTLIYLGRLASNFFNELSPSIISLSVLFPWIVILLNSFSN
jgi:dynein assembly factor with WDR repeat domains 1